MDPDLWIVVLWVDPDSGSAFKERPIHNTFFLIIFLIYATLLSQAAEKQTENWPASFKVLGGTGFPVQKYF
jgi:hypothetical protein